MRKTSRVTGAADRCDASNHLRRVRSNNPLFLFMHHDWFRDLTTGGFSALKLSTWYLIYLWCQVWLMMWAGFTVFVTHCKALSHTQTSALCFGTFISYGFCRLCVSWCWRDKDTFDTQLSGENGLDQKMTGADELFDPNLVINIINNIHNINMCGVSWII